MDVSDPSAAAAYPLTVFAPALATYSQGCDGCKATEEGATPEPAGTYPRLRSAKLVLSTEKTLIPSEVLNALARTYRGTAVKTIVAVEEINPCVAVTLSQPVEIGVSSPEALICARKAVARDHVTVLEISCCVPSV
jgi:hypothetical protein